MLPSLTICRVQDVFITQSSVVYSTPGRNVQDVVYLCELRFSHSRPLLNPAPFYSEERRRTDLEAEDLYRPPILGNFSPGSRV